MNNSINSGASQNTFRVHLEKLSEQSGIAWAVGAEALVYDEPEIFFKDLLNHGCVSGMVWSLIYFTDTHAFFDKHYDEIEAIREEFEDGTGLPLTIKGDLKNFLAWFAFEETAYRIAVELELA